MINTKFSGLVALLASTASAQVYQTGGRAEDAFSYIQPEDTVVLGQYGHSEPVYPSPRVSGTGGWEDAVEKARAFVGELTLQEKADMVTGQAGPCVGNIYPIPRLNFTGLCLQDGPASLRTADFVSAFPAGVTIASSWDKKMMYDRSLAMGREFRAKGAQIALAPAVGPMGRSAYSGRNWEGFSPDPYLSGIAMEKSILGLQDAGVQATAKHYILNEQEILRNPVYFPNGTLQYESISSNADDRTMHEHYLWPFANAVHANTASVMCSYQRINGSYGCQNSKVLNGLLKEELGFQGYVMSDWYGVHSGVASIEAGLDMDMPGWPRGRVVINETQTYNSFFGGNITTGVNNGTIDTERLDDMITRIMTPYYALNQDEGFPSVDPSIVRLNTFALPSTWLREWNLTGPARRDVRENHGELIRKHAAASTVLLKNENNALPLKAPKSIAVYGNDAGDVTEGPLNQEKFEFGTLAVGGGSGASHFTYLISPLEAIKARGLKDGALVEAWLNNTLVLTRDGGSWAATPAPNEPDVCLVFLKGWAREAVDRESLSLDWRGDELVEAVAATCNNTVVVTHSAGINVLPWAEHPNVTAILAAHYPGQESGNSIIDVLYGDVNPSGHLPYTIARNASDYNAPIVTNVNTTGLDDWQSYFDEKLETDYRYFDAHDIDVLYEFGFGLSYTTFELSSFTVEAEDEDAQITSRPADREIQPGGNPALWETIYTAEVTVRNTGDVTGDAVPQLYVTFPDSTPEGTPLRQLRGFNKIELGAGQRGKVAFELMRRDLSYWDVTSQQWLIPEGEFTLHVGFSSRDLVQTASLTVVEGGNAGNSTARRY
ncbi:beta-glucosidase [Plectosphaerella plurivora]|uniref:Beta-glucosidase cel3A n=1 Tax=Plectosphaerella plurivora TaxID=936078 RepID=A0A9P8VA51_9PEZI|nr:beta-glucosidase [Plectosphaerella plurivora]